MEEFISDLHLHSPYSRATSKRMDLLNLREFALKKGIKLLGTGDFTHPLWFSKLKNELKEVSEGVFKLKGFSKEVLFLISGEVSCTAFDKGGIRKVHHLILVPSFEIAEKINFQLKRYGSLSEDGRPILKIKSSELLELLLSINEKIILIPAHAWTPHFSIFGSNSGYDSLEECFGSLKDKILAIETGLSSDPPMNWRVSFLDNLILVSFSDAHSPENLGREATVFKAKISYNGIFEILSQKEKGKVWTVEFYPQEGKYHFDGHRFCKIRLSPEERKKLNGVCPKCSKKVTIGVMSRVEELSSRNESFLPKETQDFKYLVPLREIIAQALNLSSSSLKVEKIYNQLVSRFAPELYLLLKESLKELSLVYPQVAEGIENCRKGKIEILPGFDGQYGKVKVFPSKGNVSFQENLF